MSDELRARVEIDASVSGREQVSGLTTAVDTLGREAR